jgi:hypothetical protein
MNPRAAWILIVAVALVALLMTFGWPRRPPIRSRFGAWQSGLREALVRNGVIELPSDTKREYIAA